MTGCAGAAARVACIEVLATKSLGPEKRPELQGVCSRGCSVVRFAGSSDGGRKSTARNGCATEGKRRSADLESV